MSEEDMMNLGCCEETMGRTFRAGDKVKHRQTGETWELAVDEEHGKVMPNGWPESLAEAKDCTLVKAGSDEARMENLESWAAKGKGYEHERDLRTLKARRQMSEIKESQSNDKSVWSRKTTPEDVEPFKSYAEIRVQNDGNEMTLCLGGTCCTMSIEEWHEVAMERCNAPA